MARTKQEPGRANVNPLTSAGIVVGVLVAVLFGDVILGVIAGATFIAITVGLVRLWTSGGTPHPHDR